jgi:hypothetical protein
MPAAKPSHEPTFRVTANTQIAQIQRTLARPSHLI